MQREQGKKKQELADMEARLMDAARSFNLLQVVPIDCNPTLPLAVACQAFTGRNNLQRCGAMLVCRVCLQAVLATLSPSDMQNMLRSGCALGVISAT